ncbi:MAG: hypothetical protein SRB1_01559 [Desulfobacteraceae bacterium Eth-SRB1]|nr:MAG: hypothetical protein SRB1_01559 [Desulfobacteraceae bacterium Eth-SRB1]
MHRSPGTLCIDDGDTKIRVIMISKKPRIGATAFIPRETRIMRSVPKDTSIILARQMRSGTTAKVKMGDCIRSCMIVSAYEFLLKLSTLKNDTALAVK